MVVYHTQDGGKNEKAVAFNRFNSLGELFPEECVWTSVQDVCRSLLFSFQTNHLWTIKDLIMITKMAKHLQRNMQRDSTIEPNFHRLTHTGTEVTNISSF